MSKPVDLVVVGAGIVGLATAYQLLKKAPLRLVILETEAGPARHQTGNNSGVIHSGLYYKPGSYKAKNCVEGRTLLYQFCEEHGIRHEACGKLVVATNEEENKRLDSLRERGIQNGLQGLKLLMPAEIREIEPHVFGTSGLWVPETGIADYVQMSEKLLELVSGLGGEFRPGQRFLQAQETPGGLRIQTTAGDFEAKALVACAGLQSDRVARACGLTPDVQIVPFRGEYYLIKPEVRGLVNGLVYPVPDPRFPFLGVHFTRRVTGEIEAGPNAVPAFARHGYSWWNVSVRDCLEMIRFPGIKKLFLQHYKMAGGEAWRSLYKPSFVHALRKLVPEIQSEHLQRGGAGVRAQALDRDGRLLDDFHFLRDKRMIHVLNAPSPAATASLSIGQTLAQMVIQQFDLKERTA